MQESVFDNKALYLVVVVIVLLSCVAWLLDGIIHDEQYIYLRIVKVIVGILAVFLLVQRDVYLPFLGQMAFPTGLLKSVHVPTSKDMTIVKLKNLPPNTLVVYWAALPNTYREAFKETETQSWKQSYGEFTNSGVVKTSDDGTCDLSVVCPQMYNVKNRHVHYRYELPTTKGMLSSVRTVKLDSC